MGRIIWLLGLCTLILIAFEIHNRSVVEISSKGLETRVVNWHSVMFDTMSDFEIEHGSTFLEADYTTVGIQDDFLVARIELAGKIVFGDGYSEIFKKDCIRRGVTTLDRLPNIIRNNFSSVVDTSKICFIKFDHNLNYEKKGDGIAAISLEEGERVMSMVVNQSSINKVKATVYARKKPTKIERYARDKVSLIELFIRAKIDWLLSKISEPFSRD